MGLVIFNGVSSKDFGLEVEHRPKYNIPEKDYDITHVPGRNGDVYIDKNSYKNVTRTYEVSIGSEDGVFVDMASALADWLYSASGYARLEDSYEPDYYRMASYHKSTSFTNIYGKALKTSIEFDCKPERYLKSGEQPIEFSTSGVVLHNPTNFASKPIITVIGSGEITLKIGEQYVRIINCNGGIVLNSVIEDAYYNSLNRNSSIELSNGFPKLEKGETVITFTGSVESISVIPNWWRL